MAIAIVRMKLLTLALLLLTLFDALAFMGTPVFGHKRLVPSQKHGASSLEMRARVCDLLGKSPNRKARTVTFSHKRNKRVQHVNLQWKRFYSGVLKRKVRLRVSTKGLKTVNKMGSIDAVAKKFDVDLSKF